ncbi:peptidoglycan-binding protein [Roseospira marina]|uniref:Peptidoglycan-binding protein n=1 Tax=Roseospira marina TaxID=140057 RepID=A0A5M6IGJ4_9PROT|nr:peptidoglycan-binding domain-containing protein [Roseospira marina]KAA5606879.1 peptidoglycan-binding protein [Roseospira marina]MBB4312953.1 hypothetical protein [Roseospira marina]MBB5086274.1 hypothetical protein [Roseospira marina]
MHSAARRVVLALLLGVGLWAGGLWAGFVGDARADMTTLAVQYLLREAGDYDGGLDGDRGAQTEAALQAFQARNGLPQTGQADDRTLSILRILQRPRAVGVGRSLRAALRQGFKVRGLEPDWSSLRDVEAFSFRFQDYGLEWSYVHVCGTARFPDEADPARPRPFMMDMVHQDAQGNTDAGEAPPIEALLDGNYVFSDLWMSDFVFVEPFCRLRVGSAVALGLVR